MDYKIDFTANGVTTVTNANGKVIGSFEQTNRTVVKTDKSLAAYNAQSMKAAKNANDLAGALEIVSANMANANGLYGTAMAGATSLAGAYKGLTGGVSAFGLVIKKIPKLLNPYLFLFDTVTSKLMEFAEWFADKPKMIEEESKKIEEAAKRESDAIKRLTDVLKEYNGLITVQEARQRIVKQQAKEDWFTKYASAYEHEKRLIKEIAIAEADLEEQRTKAHEKYIKEGMGRGLWGETALKHEQEYLDKYTKDFSKKLNELKKEILSVRQTLTEGAKQVLVNNLEFWYDTSKKLITKIWDNLGKVEDKTLTKGRGKGKDKWLKEFEQELAYLEELERKWLHKLRDDQKHSHEELARIAIEEEKEAARKRIKNAENLQKALYLIEGRGAIEIKMAREQDEKEEQKRIEAMERRIAAMTKKSNKLLEQLNPKDKGNEGEEAQKVSHAYGDDVRRMEDELGRVREMLAEMAKMPTEERARVWEQEKALAEQELKITGDIFYRKMKYERDYAIARKKDNAQRIKEEWDFSNATKAAIKANIQGLNSWQEALNLFDKGCTAVQVLQMTASGIQAGADAVNLNAEALAAFSLGDIGRGIGLEAAAAGKIAAVAAYIKGLAELGQNSGKVQEPSTSKGGGSSVGTTYGALTGATEEHQTIDINLLYSWTDSQIANALIRGMNATAKSSGSARIDKRIIQG